jgi:hypothetical protein
MPNPTKVCIFNTVSALIDITNGVDGVVVPSTGAAQAGAPVVLNPSGLIDASLLGVQSVRFSAGTINAGTMGGPFTINFATAFADGNYTVEATAVVGEAMSTAPCYVGGVQQQGTPGVGVKVWVANNDSINHTVVINVHARHD